MRGVIHMVDPNKNNKYRSKITDELREEIFRVFVEEDLSQRQLAKRYGISAMSVSNIIRDKISQLNQGSLT